MINPRALQNLYAAQSTCFGCGPANDKGLRVESVPMIYGAGSQLAEVTATWTPEKYHEAFPGMLNGGIIGTLLDCHSNWTAAWHLMKHKNLDRPPCTVTSEYAVKLLRPTPTGAPITLSAKVLEIKPDRVVVEATLTAKGKICASCKGTFVPVPAGHPAYHRW